MIADCFLHALGDEDTDVGRYLKQEMSRLAERQRRFKDLLERMERRDDCNGDEPAPKKRRSSTCGVRRLKLNVGGEPLEVREDALTSCDNLLSILTSERWSAFWLRDKRGDIYLGD